MKTENQTSLNQIRGSIQTEREGRRRDSRQVRDRMTDGATRARQNPNRDRQAAGADGSGQAGIQTANTKRK